MRILIIGAGGVGSSFVPTALRRDFFEHLVVADYDESRARTVADRAADERVSAARVDASDRSAVADLVRASRATHVLNAVDPRFVMPIFEACLDAGSNYLDMAMSLSKPHRERPHELPGVKLGDEQFALAGEWERRGLLALVGMGVEPGLSDVFARYAADHLFESIDEIGVRDGANLVVKGYEFAPSFSIWTTIEECLNPPVVWEDRGWHTTPPFSEPETFDFPEGIGPVECVNVEHEEVLLIPRWVDARRVTFKYGLGEEFIDVLKTLHKLGLDRTEKVRVGGAEVSPRDVVAAVLPDPATLGEAMSGLTCAGTWVRGTGKDGRPHEVYLYHVVDNARSMAEYGSQAVVWQTAVNPVVALELLASGAWSGAGVLGPEAFDAVPFLDLLSAYGSPWGMREGAGQPTPSDVVSAPVHVRDELLRLERALAERDTSDVPNGLASLVTDDFLEFGSSGRVWNSQSVHQILASAPGPVSIEDFAVDLVADDVALATYRMTAPIPSNRSSLWVRRDGRWVMRFHQGTPTPAPRAG